MGGVLFCCYVLFVFFFFLLAFFFFFFCVCGWVFLAVFVVLFCLFWGSQNNNMKNNKLHILYKNADI